MRSVTSACRGLSHIVLSVSDMEQSVHFYTELCGWEKVFEARFEGPDFERMVGIPGATGWAIGGRIGDLRLEFSKMSWWTAPLPGWVPNAKLSFEVDSADRALATLSRLGIPMVAPLREINGCRILMIEDPDSQRIDLIEYERGTSAWGGEGSRTELRRR
jgi:catechol 2,3-dioxygenase-like lactoylglutathione lyase family enzyme